MFNWQRRAKPDGPTVLDEDYLERLEKHLGEAVLRELLSDGLLELTDKIAMVESHIATGAVESLRRTAHDLAGMAGHLGLAELSGLAVQAERDLRSDDIDLSAAAQPFIDVAPSAISALREFLDEAGAP